MAPKTSALRVRAECTDTELLESVIAFYRERLKEHPPALAYLQDRGLTDPALLDEFELGYADRALGRALPKPQLAAGKQIRGRLQRLGIYRPTGHGHFNGCIVVPIRNAEHEVVQLCGRKIGRHVNDRKTLHVTMAAECLPAVEGGGLLNALALAATDEVVLTDSVLNGLTFWSAGVKNVVATLPDDDFTDTHLNAFKTYSIGRVLVAYRNTEAGNQAAEAATTRLVAAGHAVDRVTFPPGLDANDYCLREGPEALVAHVRQIGTSETGNREQETGDRGQSGDREQEPGNRGHRNTETPTTETPTTDTIVKTFGDRRYRVRGLDKNHSAGRLKVNLLVSRDDLLHVDTLDLYAARSRNTFIKQASGEIFIEEETIKRDLSKILLELETLQETQIQERLAIEGQEEQPVMTEPERAEALEFLHDPNLLDRILADYDRCGIVGEETNKLVCYLACVSRRLPEPLAVMIQSGSGSGKTALLDATLAFMPPEDQIQYSALTGQALYYMGTRSMKHKILAVSEEEGVAQAAYALKLLQSDGRLRIAAAEKDGDTGRQKTQDYEVEGPVMMFLTTTAQNPDPELQNRCLTLRVNESETQTAAIHARQRAVYTLSGQVANDTCQKVTTVHQNAQRLLAAHRVIIPWADQLTFRRDQASMRRDHAKYLALIAASALLHQYQRPKRTDAAGVSHIEATLQDIALAGRLAGETLGQNLDDLLPQTRRLLKLLDDYVTRRLRHEQKPRPDMRFTQRELRETLGWSDRSIRRHLLRLVELEYVLVYRTGRGNERQYQLVYDGEGRDGRRFLLGLIDVGTLQDMKYDDRTGGQNGRTGTLSAPIRRPSGTQPAAPKNDITPSGTRPLRQKTPIPSQNGTQDLGVASREIRVARKKRIPFR